MMDEEVKKKSKSGGFQSFGLSLDVLKAINRMGYKVPTPVQRKTLPVVLAGMDVVCMARTGSGKTCVFLVPMIEKLKSHDGKSGVRAIILSPTRELAMQSFRFAKDVAKFTDLRIVSLIGGDPIEPQFEALSHRPDIIIATPGRLMHHLHEISTFKLHHVQYLVFDEADRLFEMGFAEQLNEIIRQCPENRQTLLFSATLPKMLVQFTRAGLRDPQLIRLDTDIKMSEELRMGFFITRSTEKVAALLYLVRFVIPQDQLTIIFTATRHHSEYLHALLQYIGMSSTVVYGSMDQDARSMNLKLFRNGEVKIMIVTDLAARGIDVPLLNNVINFHTPPSPKLFVHRCGRAARQGRIGFAFTLVEPDEIAYMMDIHTFLEKEMNNEKGKYVLTEMTPSMIHTGLLPPDAIAEEVEYLKTVTDDNVRMLTRVCDNAMKQYRRTRQEASKSGVKLAKQVVKQNKIVNIHPLLVGMDPVRANDEMIEKSNFIRQLQTFRPAQTVFETGIGTSTGNIKNQSILKDGKGASMMKELRRAMAPALERLKPKKTDAGEERIDKDEFDDDVLEMDNDEFDVAIEVESDDESVQEVSDDEHHPEVDSEDEVQEQPVKKRITAAERKKLKKQGIKGGQVGKHVAQRQAHMNEVDIQKTETSFRDSKYYMSYGTENEVATYQEVSLQPQSSLKSSEAMSAAMLENALLDVIPDDTLDMNKKKRMMRWDAKKRKFVKQSLEEIAQQKGNKRIRTESGAVSTKSSLPQGELYKKWKKKTHREVGGEGDDDYDDRPTPNVKYNKHVKSEIRDAGQIRQLKKKKDNLKLKNMKKDKRKSIENHLKKKKASKETSNFSTNARNRRSKVIVRY